MTYFPCHPQRTSGVCYQSLSRISLVTGKQILFRVCHWSRMNLWYNHKVCGSISVGSINVTVVTMHRDRVITRAYCSHTNDTDRRQLSTFNLQFTWLPWQRRQGQVEIGHAAVSFISINKDELLQREWTRHDAKWRETMRATQTTVCLSWPVSV